MRPGMACTVEFGELEETDVLYVPVRAVFAVGKGYVCFVWDGSVERRKVELGRRNERWVQIRAGLEQDEFVLLGPAAEQSQETASGDARVRGVSLTERDRARRKQRVANHE